MQEVSYDTNYSLVGKIKYSNIHTNDDVPDTLFEIPSDSTLDKAATNAKETVKLAVQAKVQKQIPVRTMVRNIFIGVLLVPLGAFFLISWILRRKAAAQRKDGRIDGV